MNAKKNEYERQSVKLNERKQKLFEEKKTENWSSPTDVPKDIVSHKDTIYNLMLPKETKEVRDMFSTYGYYLNKLLEETERINSRDYSKLRKALLAYTNQQSEISKMVLYFAVVG